MTNFDIDSNMDIKIDMHINNLYYFEIAYIYLSIFLLYLDLTLYAKCRGPYNTDIITEIRYLDLM